MSKNLGGIDSPVNESQGGTNATTFNAARANLGLNATINSQTLGYTALTSDRGRLIHYTGAGGVTLALDPAATLLNGWSCIVRNDAALSITINPDAGELINGAATLTLEAGQAITVICDGTGFYTQGQAAAPAGTGADTALSNLVAVAINESLISDTDVTDDLGSLAIRWNNIYAQALNTGDTVADTLKIRGYDVDGATYVDFLTVSAGNTPTAVLNGDVTSTTQAPNDNSTKLATTAYADAAAAAGGATVALDNLVGVAVNTSLISDTDITDDLGSAAKRWKDLYVEKIQGAIVYGGIVSTGDITTDQDNFNPAGLSTCSILDLEAYTNPITITGLAGGEEGRIITIWGKNSELITLKNSSGSSLAANRFQFPGYGTKDYILSSSESDSITFIWRTANGCWVWLNDYGRAGTNLSTNLNSTAELTALSMTLTPAQITSNQNDYDIPPLNSSEYSVVRLSTDASRDITGIVAVESGHIYILYNVGSFDVVLKDQSASSSAVNRFELGGSDLTLTANDSATIQYDETTSRWRLIATTVSGTDSGANTALSNLAAVAVNTSLISDTDVTDDLGSLAIRWNNIYAQALNTGDTAADTLKIRGYDVDGATYVDFLTVTAGNTPTCVLNGDITTTTQSFGDSSTKIATTAFVQAAREQIVNGQTAGYTAVAGDLAKVIRYTGAGGVTLALTAAATLTDGWFTTLRNDSSGTITINPDAAETINGAATLDVSAGNAVIIYTNGTLFYTVGSNTGGSFTAASQAEMETASSTTVGVTPGRQQYHPSAPKVWGKVEYSAGVPTLQSPSYNMTSITDTATGRLTLTFNVDFSSGDYATAVTNSAVASTQILAIGCEATPAAGSCILAMVNSATAALTDPVNGAGGISWIICGDQ